ARQRYALQVSCHHTILSRQDSTSEPLKRPLAYPNTLVFAPSWLHKSHPETGSDFAFQRGIIGRLGISSRLIVSGESDSVEANAAVIVDTIRAIGCSGGPVVIVSASKSGAAAALALAGLTPA